MGEADAIGDGRDDPDGEGEAWSPAVGPEHETTSIAIQSATRRPMHGQRREYLLGYWQSKLGSGGCEFESCSGFLTSKVGKINRLQPGGWRNW